MNAKISRCKLCRALPVALALLLALVVAVLAAGNIDPTHKWAWGTNTGWLNFAPDNGGVVVYADHLEGYAWAENIGWVRLGTCTGGSPCTHANTGASNYGVNHDGAGNLSGYAWSATAGWINFAPSGGGVIIDPTTGDFDGYAWGENTGWLRFNNHADYKVRTTWPSAPALNPIANADGDGNYTVSWNSATGATGYTLQEANNSAFTGATTVYSGSGTSTALSGKAPGTHYYRVRAANVGGDSAWSNTQSVVVIAPPSAPALNAITNADGDGNYTVSWNSATGATGYTLQEANNSAFTGATTAYSGSGTSTALSGKAPGTHYYRVRAANVGGDSAWSNTRSVVVKAWIYLPLALRDYVTYFEGPWEVEPNDTWQQANGPLVSGRTYYGTFPSAADTRDYFSLYLRSSQSVELWLSNIGAGHNYDLVLRNTALQLVGYSANLGNANEHIRTGALAPGWYYIQVYNYGGTGSTQGYNLKVVQPAAALVAGEGDLPAPQPTPAPPEP